MVLSNAERQARYRKNIKARANDPAASARAAADAAAEAIWAMFSRIGEGSVADFPKFEDWRVQFFRDDLADSCRSMVDDPDCTPDELAAIRAVVAIDDALKLKHARTPPET
jgi:hypothetical protein